MAFLFFLFLLYFLYCREVVRLYFGKLKTAIFENCSPFKISSLGSSFFIWQICEIFRKPLTTNSLVLVLVLISYIFL